MSGGSMTAERRSLGRRRDDRKWPRILRDFWLVIITFLVWQALAGGQDANDHAVSAAHQAKAAATQAKATAASNQVSIERLKKDGQALCSFRDDLQARADSTQRFLLDHPTGIPGIPASVLRVSLQNELHTLKSLSRLVC